jgi:SAM-dependent methyltransferase
VRGRNAEWEPEAENWVRWARTPNHDAYWYYSDAFLEDLLPAAGNRTIEIGCGEGRVARDLTARGHRVTVVDTSSTLLSSARADDSQTSYVLADSATLPFSDASFDLVVAYNSLQVVADMPGTVREAARLLDGGGHFCVCVSHPLADLGDFIDDALDASFVVRKSYFGVQRVEDTVNRDGLQMTFTGWCYALEDYAIAFEEAGLRIEAIREPRPSAAAQRYKGWRRRYERWRRLPMFLNIRANKS